MTKDEAINLIDKYLVMDGEEPSEEYAELRQCLFNYMSNIQLEDFAKFVKDEYSI